MPAMAPAPRLPSATIPLGLLAPSGKRHYFDPAPTPVPFTRRAFKFWGEPVLMPLVRAFIRTCAAGRDEDYTYLFDLLGTELVGNALAHTRSGQPGGTFTLHAQRYPAGTTLTCRDEGNPAPGLSFRDRADLPAPASDPDPLSDTGRGLTLINTLATQWGDTGRPTHREVWFHLAYDLNEGPWPKL